MYSWYFGGIFKFILNFSGSCTQVRSADGASPPAATPAAGAGDAADDPDAGNPSRGKLKAKDGGGRADEHSTATNSNKPLRRTMSSVRRQANRKCVTLSSTPTRLPSIRSVSGSEPAPQQSGSGQEESNEINDSDGAQFTGVDLDRVQYFASMFLTVQSSDIKQAYFEAWKG